MSSYTARFPGSGRAQQALQTKAVNIFIKGKATCPTKQPVKTNLSEGHVNTHVNRHTDTSTSTDISLRTLA